MKSSKKAALKEDALVPQNSLESKLGSAYMESLAVEQHQADTLKENANLRQELESLRSELVKQKMKNFLLTKQINEAMIYNSKLEQANDIQNLQNELLVQAKNFLSLHQGGDDAVNNQQSKLNLFESLFKCFPITEKSFLQEAQSLDQKLMRLLSESLKSELSKTTKAVQEKHHIKYEDWLQKFRIGLKIQNYANTLEVKLWSHKLIAEFRNIVLTLATNETKIGLLKAIRTLEKCVDTEYVS